MEAWAELGQTWAQDEGPAALGPLAEPAEQPGEGEVVGREKDGSTAQHPLYVGHAAIDTRLRSDHLTWLGPGALLLRSSMFPMANGLARPVKGPTPLRDGELLWLTESTWIVGRG